MSYLEKVASYLDFTGRIAYALDPCVRQDALGVLTGKVIDGVYTNTNRDVHLYAVGEEESVENVRQNYKVALSGSYLDDIYITQQTFSFVYLQPPYGAAEERGINAGKRLEVRYLEDVWKDMTYGGILVLDLKNDYSAEVSNSGLFRDQLFAVYLLSHFEILKGFSYREGCVLFLRKKQFRRAMDEEVDAFTAEHPDFGSLEELAENEGEKILIPDSVFGKLTSFRNKALDPKRALSVVVGSNQADDLFDLPKGEQEILRPGTELNSGNAALLGISGVGSGLMGDPEEGTQHLMGGFVSGVTQTETEPGVEGRVNVREIRSQESCIVAVYESPGPDGHYIYEYK